MSYLLGDLLRFFDHLPHLFDSLHLGIDHSSLLLKHDLDSIITNGVPIKETEYHGQLHKEKYKW